MDAVALGAAFAALAAFGGAWRIRRRAEVEVARLRMELQAERHAATHDALTGLPNRRAFYQLGAALLSERGDHPLVAMVVDVDHFKKINDRFGHAAGDEVLVTVARRLSAYAGHNLVARLGGDEFAGVLRVPSADERGLRKIEQALTAAIAAPMHVTGHHLRVSVSVGLFPVDSSAQLTEALGRADAAMYRVKTGVTAPANRSLDDEFASISAIRPSARVRNLDPDEVGHAVMWLNRQPANEPTAPRRLADTTARTEAGG